MPPQQRRIATQGQGFFSQFLKNLITFPFRLIIGGVTSLFSLFKSKPKPSEPTDTVGKEQAESSAGLDSDDMGLDGLATDSPKETEAEKEASEAPSTGLEGIMGKAPPAQPKNKTPQQAAPAKKQPAQDNEKDPMATFMEAMGKGAGKESSHIGSPSSPLGTPKVANTTRGHTR